MKGQKKMLTNSSSNKPTSYTGVDNLEVMADAHNYNQYLFDLVEKNIGQREKVLDFGAGIGTYLDYFQQKNSFQLTGVEVDLNLYNVLKEKGHNIYQQISEIPQNSFDAFYTLNVLEHIEQDKEALQSLAKILKSGGVGFIYLPAFNFLYSSMDKKVGHFRRYNKKMLKNLLGESGIQIKKIRYVDSLGFFVTILFKIIGNKSGNINPKSLKFYDKVIFPLSRFLDLFLGAFLGKNILAVVEKK